MPLTKIQFDPQFGTLLMTQDQNMIRLFSTEHENELDHYPSSRKLISASFLPLRNSPAPGIIALYERSSVKFHYFQIEEG